MTDVISRKSDVRILLETCLEAYRTGGVSLCVDVTDQELLQQKVKFPLLEFCAEQFAETIVEHEQVAFCDLIEALKTEGGNVILGKLMQLRLEHHFDESLQKAAEYISQADVWYVCDIIGERVFGVALLQKPDIATDEIEEMFRSKNRWVRRGLGAGVHYAVKKGLGARDTERLFFVLLQYANDKDKEVRQGVGWAAKTIARFHPQIIGQYQDKLNDDERVASWFRKKVFIGLSRNRYVEGN